MIALPDHIPDLRRLRAFLAIVLAAFAVIVARLWYLQIVLGPELEAMSVTLRSRMIRRVAARGQIVNAKGRVLVTNRPNFVVSVLPDELKKNPQVLPRLATLLHSTVDDLNDKIDANRTTPFDPVPLAGDVKIDTLTEIEEQKLDLPGVLITKDPTRVYLDDQLCTHVLGVVRPISKERLDRLRDKGYRGGNSIGVEGIEKVYESDLRGKNGGTSIEVDARGRTRRSVEEIKPNTGRTLKLTIDRDLQQVAYDALKGELAMGHAGAAVAMDPRDGAVLAFVSVPSYDLNKFGSDYGAFRADPKKPLIDRVSGSFYPCGSPFKLITAAAGLQSGAIEPYTRDLCTGQIKVGNRIFHCDKRTGHGWIDFEHAIGSSCDVYFWHVGAHVGRTRLADWAHKFGLGAPTGIDLPVDAKGIIPTEAWKRKHRRGAWVPGDTLNMAIGQGNVGVTPLQLVDFTAALANGGTLWEPRVVREVLDPTSNRPIRSLEPVSRGDLGLSPDNRSAIVRGMARALESGGTAAGLAIPGVTMAGKTGTAEAFMKGKPVSHSVFVCFAPIENPKIAVAVLVEGGGFGADVAAPIARQIVAKYLRVNVGPLRIVQHHASGRD